MKVNPKNYLIVGITKNWYRAFEHNPPVWGFTERERSAWDVIQSGDIIYFYAAREAKGIIGKGVILNKFRSDDPYWEEEIQTNIVKWPLHFYIQPICLLPPNMWLAGKGPVASSEFDISGTDLHGKQIIALNAEQVTKIEEKISLWSVVAVGISKPTVKELAVIREQPTVKYSTDLHTNLIRILEEIGKLQNFYPQTEFSIPNENRRIDVVWRREFRGTPTYAFEVELSGGVDRALNKLYRCYRLWSTLPRIITPSSEFSKIHSVSYSLGFKDLVIPITPEHIKEIYDKKKSFKEKEKEVGLL